MSKSYEDARAEQRRKGLELMAFAQVAGAPVEVKPGNDAEAKIYRDALASARRGRARSSVGRPVAVTPTVHARPRERRETRRRTTRSTGSSSDDPDPDEPGDAGHQAVGHLAADLLQVVHEARSHARSALALLHPTSLAAPVLERAIGVLDGLAADLEDLVDRALETRP